MFRSIFMLALSIALVACGPSSSALRGHSHAAQTLDSIAADAKATVLELRQAELDEAARDGKSAGLADADLRQFVVLAAAQFDQGPKIHAVNAFVAAKDLYVRAVLIAVSQDPPSWAEAKAVLKDVIASYSELRAALGNPSRLPPIPQAIVDLLAWHAAQENEEVVS
jgi:hypothetical protein